MKRLRRVLLVLVVLAGVAFMIWWFTRSAPVKVLVAAVQKGRVEATVANTRAGSVRAERRARLAPAVGGRVVALPVKEGERVAKGQVLLELWNEDVHAELAQAEADVQQARARSEESCLHAQNLEQDAERLVRLEQQKVAAGEKADRAVAEAKAARAACHAAEAQIAVLLAHIEVVKAALDRTVLRAPFGGVVAEVNAELGEFATPSPPGIPTLPAVELIDTGSLYVKAPIDEVDAPAVHAGQSARITMDAFPGQTFQGRVRRVAPFVEDHEKQARTVDVEVEFVEPQAGERLLPGYSADVEIVLEVRDDVLRVPSEAVLEGNKVLVWEGDASVLSERSLQRGLANWHFTQVTGGLRAGELVVVSLSREGVRAGVKAVAERAPQQP